jgi:hypothetical protein
MRRAWKPSPEVARRAAVAVCEAEVRQCRAEYHWLIEGPAAGLAPGLAGRFDDARARYFHAVERLDEARGGRAVTWPEGQGEPIGLSPIPIRPA